MNNDYEKKWYWKMDWCKKNGLAPAKKEIWELAEKAYNEKVKDTQCQENKHYHK